MLWRLKPDQFEKITYNAISKNSVTHVPIKLPITSTVRNRLTKLNLQSHGDEQVLLDPSAPLQSTTQFQQINQKSILPSTAQKLVSEDHARVVEPGVSYDQTCVLIAGGYCHRLHRISYRWIENGLLNRWCNQEEFQAFPRPLYRFSHRRSRLAFIWCQWGFTFELLYWTQYPVAVYLQLNVYAVALSYQY